MEGARKLGYTFTTRTPQTVTVDVHGQLMQFDILNVLEFTSTRKRMSVSQLPTVTLFLWLLWSATRQNDLVWSAN